jgi:hypothetical protein
MSFVGGSAQHTFQILRTPPPKAMIFADLAPSRLDRFGDVPAVGGIFRGSLFVAVDNFETVAESFRFGETGQAATTSHRSISWDPVSVKVLIF